MKRAELRKISGTMVPAQYNSETLRNIMDKITSLMLCLQELGVKSESHEEETNNALFPKHMKTRWRQSWEEDQIHKLKDILTNIGKEIRILDAEEIARPIKTQNEEKKEQPKGDYRPCFTCKSTANNPHQCRSGTAEDRKQFYISNKKCLKCLWDTHSTNTCPSEIKCILCGGNDHSMAVCTEKSVRPKTTVTCMNKTDNMEKHSL